MSVDTRPRTELVMSLDDLVDAITTAVEHYDEGNCQEARVLAGRISDLVELLDELGLHNELTWVDTAGVVAPETAAATSCLTLMNIRTGHQPCGEYVPKLGLYPPAPIRTRAGGHIDRGSRIPFDDWWTNPVVKDSAGAEYSRKQLVFALATPQSGDCEARAARAALADSMTLGWVLSAQRDTAEATWESNPVLASVRQIGYEVLRSIQQQRDVIAARN